MGVYTVSKRKRKLISVTVDPELYVKAREKKINLSGLLDQAIEHKLSAQAHIPIDRSISTMPIIPLKKASKSLYKCDFCGTRSEGQYHILEDRAYCNTCGRLLDRKTE